MLGQWLRVVRKNRPFTQKKITLARETQNWSADENKKSILVNARAVELLTFAQNIPYLPKNPSAVGHFWNVNGVSLVKSDDSNNICILLLIKYVLHNHLFWNRHSVNSNVQFFQVTVKAHVPLVIHSTCTCSRPLHYSRALLCIILF